jgi:hypothetical protein
MKLVKNVMTILKSVDEAHSGSLPDGSQP